MKLKRTSFAISLLPITAFVIHLQSSPTKSYPNINAQAADAQRQAERQLAAAVALNKALQEQVDLDHHVQVAAGTRPRLSTVRLLRPF